MCERKVRAQDKRHEENVFIFVLVEDAWKWKTIMFKCVNFYFIFKTISLKIVLFLNYFLIDFQSIHDGIFFKLFAHNSLVSMVHVIHIFSELMFSDISQPES